MDAEQDIQTVQGSADPAGTTLNYSAPPDAGGRRHSAWAVTALATSLVAPVTIAVMAAWFAARRSPPPRVPWAYLAVAAMFGAPVVSLGLAVVGMVVRRRRRWPAWVALVITGATLLFYGVSFMLVRF